MKKYLFHAFALSALTLGIQSCELPNTQPDDDIQLVAEAGTNQTVGVFEEVELDGSQSFTSEGSLTYSWAFISKPDESNSSISASNEAIAHFTPDQEGTYVLELNVNNGKSEQKDQISITAEKRVLQVSGLIEEATTWRKIADEGEPDYWVKDDLYLFAPLTIEPGVIVQVSANKGIYITGNGSLDAVGTASNKIIFTGLEETKGYWAGLGFQSSNSANNELDFVEVKYGGADPVYDDAGKANIMMIGNSRLKISNTLISQGAHAGFSSAHQSEAVLSNFENVQITHNDEVAMHISHRQLTALMGSFEFQNNGTNAVAISGTIEFSSNFTWPALANEIPYLVNNSIYVSEGALSIAPGVLMQFSANTGIWVYNSSALKAEGTVEQPIILSGLVKEPGYWSGIYIESNNVENRLSHLTIEHAGGESISGAEEASIHIEGGARAALNNVVIRHSGRDGLYIAYDGNLSGSSHLTISENGRYPVSTPPQMVASLNASTMAISGNAENLIEIREGSLSGNHIWQSAGVPYFCNGSIGTDFFSSSNLTFSEGITLIFAADKRLEINGSSSLAINGTAAQPVTIRGLQDVPGAWQGVAVYSNNILNVWNHAIITGGGSSDISYAKANIGLGAAGNCCETATLTLNDCTISNSDGYGIYLYSNSSTLTTNNISYINNQLGNLAIGD